MRKYIIVDSAEVSNFDFGQLVDSLETSRYSLDNSKILARFEGDTPSFLLGETQHTNSDILVILDGPDWTSDEII